MTKNDPKPASKTQYPLGERSLRLIGWLPLLYLLYQAGRSWVPSEYWLLRIVLVALLLPFGVLVWAATRSVMADRRLGQKRRDQTLLEGVGSCYGVFLRPFHIDATVKIANPFFRFWSGNYEEAFSLFPGEYIGRVLEPYCRVIEIGGADTSVGSNRIHGGDAHWQEIFATTIGQAAFFVIMPLLFERKGSCGQATLWELSELKAASRLDRVVVFMPRAPRFRQSSIPEAWQRARKIAHGNGIALPAFTHRGGVFTLSPQASGWCANADSAVGPYRERSLAAGLIAAVQAVTAAGRMH